MKIIGAGLSGLLAGALIPGSRIFERQASLPNNHGAILRFRSDKIGKALNIPFKKVRVTKAIWMDGAERQPSPYYQNLYSRKVTGKYTSRSISNIDPCYRYIAPDDFISQLAERCEIIFAQEFPRGVPAGGPVISTIPLPVMISELGMDQLVKYPLQFKRAPIWTRTLTFEDDVDLYQTIYFPDPTTRLYRASFTGNKMICEYTGNPDRSGGCVPIPEFGLEAAIAYEPEKTTKKQEFGKIVDIDTHIRHSLIQQLSTNRNIYSLGRYATWRNILLDDVFDDIHMIKDLIQKDSYMRRLV